MLQRCVKIIAESSSRARIEQLEYLSSLVDLPGVQGFRMPLNRSSVKVKILSRKFKQLQERLKL